MRLSDFDFSLPEALIAQRPVYPRAAARLLQVRGDGSRVDRTFADLAACLRDGDLLVFNNSQVFASRLIGQRERDGQRFDGRIEVTLVAETETSDTWICYAKPGKKLEPGDRLLFSENLTAKVEAKDGADIRLAFTNASDEAVLDAIDALGHMPLPPYIQRPKGGENSDREDYRTFCGRKMGSLAAPTASLHFDEETLESLRAARALEVAEVRLDVGLGTFAPIRSDDISDHQMHHESCALDADNAALIASARAEGRRVVAVGTTVLRALESLRGQAGAMSTDIFLKPGDDFHVVDALITNFHLPQSTLFMLVCAFSGTEAMKAAYDHAIAAEYRFFSYGDGCFLERPTG
ncbi:MAG: tRNA preQ1(34) S-adenosylmethionine ribosyltransferase-isomerase QueA [Alphaproteobacteria bacterium]